MYNRTQRLWMEWMGRKLKFYRLRRGEESGGLTIPEVADTISGMQDGRTFMHKATYDRYEKGKTMPDLDVFLDIATILGIDLNQFRIESLLERRKLKRQVECEKEAFEANEARLRAEREEREQQGKSVPRPLTGSESHPGIGQAASGGGTAVAATRPDAAQPPTQTQKARV